MDGIEAAAGGDRAREAAQALSLAHSNKPTSITAEQFAIIGEKIGIAHAQCWSHTRRKFFEAEADEPQAVREALLRIAAMYQIEEQIRQAALTDESKRLHRLTHRKPHVDFFSDWIDRQFEHQGLTPTRPFTVALAYARERRLGLEIFLTDPDVPIDTNYLERPALSELEPLQ